MLRNNSPFSANTLCLPGSRRMNVPSSVIWAFLGLEVALLCLAGFAGVKYVLLVFLLSGVLAVCLAGGLPVIFALIVISPVVFLPGIPLSTIRAGKWIFVILVVLSWLMGKAFRGERIFIPETRINHFILFFVSWGFLISLHALNPVVSFAGLLRISSIFGLFYLFTDLIRSRRDIARTVAIWIAVGTLLSGYGIVQNALSIRLYGVGQRIWSTFENPNNLGIFLFLLIPLVLSLLLVRLRLRYRIALAAVLPLLLLCLLWTGSRASWVALYVSLLGFGIIARRKYIILGMVLAGAVLALILSFSLMRGEFVSLLRLERGLALRPILWSISWRILRDHTFWGVGIGCIPFIFQSYFPVSALTLNRLLLPAAGSPHSLFLQMGAEMGLFGILAIIFFFTTYFRELRITLKQTQDQFARALVMAFLATLPGLFVHSFFELSGIIGPGSYTVFFWLSAALVQATKRKVKPGFA